MKKYILAIMLLSCNDVKEESKPSLTYRMRMANMVISPNDDLRSIRLLYKENSGDTTKIILYIYPATDVVVYQDSARTIKSEIKK